MLDPNNITEEERFKAELILKPLNSKEELRDWMYVYLDILFPMGVVYPTSTHGPIDAMWRIYELMKTGESQDVPQVCMLASRDSFKTLGAAAIEVVCMLHFRISIAHMAAIKSQSEKAVEYVNSFFRKMRPYLEYNGWRKTSDNKNRIEWLTDEGQNVYIRVIIATIAGANCVDPNTIIETSKGARKAIDIEPGDLVKTLDVWSGEEVFVEVETTGTLDADSREFIFNDGSNIVVSNKHKVFTQRGWINAGTIKIGDKVIGNGDYCKTEIGDSLTDKYIDWNLNSMVFGTLMGDASIQKLPSGNCRYQVFHCTDQLPYLEKIKETFEKNDIKASIIKDGGGYKLYTEVNEYFNNVHRICYIKGKRSPNIGWMSNVDLQALSFLVMDDGTTHRKKIGKVKESPIDIAVMDFTKDQILNIIARIKKLGYDCFLHKFGKYNQIRIPIKQSRELSIDMSRHFVDCLRYKLCVSDSIRFCIEKSIPLENRQASSGFSWSDRRVANLKIGRDFKRNIKKKFNKTIEKINNVGIQKVCGIGIKDTRGFNLKSFYANGVLVHNSEHVPILFIDEVDVVQDPRALQEAKMIPSVFKNYFPLTVYLSTRKFAGGLMEKTLKETIASGGEILRWNILDITERITPEEARTNEPKIVRYLARELPLHSLKPSEWEGLPDEEKNRYERFEAYAGIADHPLLPVMRNYLVDRPQGDFGNLYKPIASTFNNFRQIPPDMGEAQLLCNKPSSSGLVYPRFSETENVLSVRDAIERIMGQDMQINSFPFLKQYLKDLGIRFVGGADWGYTDHTSLVVLGLIPNGDVFHLDTIALPKLELDDIVKYINELQQDWGIEKWYVDQAYPAYIKTLKRKVDGFKAPAFKKVVEDGIAALQGKIVDSNNVRKYYIIDTPNNKCVIEAFGNYKWKTDGKGDIIEGKPEHGNDGTADVMDSIRYPFQCLFTKGVKLRFDSTGKKEDLQKKINTSSLQEASREVNKSIMEAKVGSLATADDQKPKGKKKNRVLWY